MAISIFIGLLVFCSGTLVCSASDERDEQSSMDDGDIGTYDDDAADNHDHIPDIRPHIINGRPVQDGDAPFQGLVIFEGKFCGGVIISESYVITAAHCVATTAPGSPAIVAVGTPQMQFFNDERSFATFVPPGDIIVHPGYSQSDLSSPDIALLRLPVPLALTSNIKPIRLPSLSQKNPNRFNKIIATATGWGIYNYVQWEPSPVLLKGSFIIVSQQLCQKYLGAPGFLCGVPYRSTVCAGDSGGPLFIEEEDGEKTLIGLVVFGDSKCSLVKPAGFVSLGAHLDWIHTVTRIPVRI